MSHWEFIKNRAHHPQLIQKIEWSRKMMMISTMSVWDKLNTNKSINFAKMFPKLVQIITKRIIIKMTVMKTTITNIKIELIIVYRISLKITSVINSLAISLLRVAHNVNMDINKIINNKKNLRDLVLQQRTRFSQTNLFTNKADTLTMRLTYPRLISISNKICPVQRLMDSIIRIRTFCTILKLLHSAK